MKRCILLVEDDELVSLLIRTALSSLGFDVVAYDDLEKITHHGAFDFCAVITDYRLPISNGCEVIAYARSRAPGIPALLVSGMGDFLIEVLAENCLTDVHILSKPFRIQELLTKIREMLPFLPR